MISTGKNRIWVLGPEIESINTIEAMLQACKEPVAYAMFNGHRVDKDTQRQADGISVRSNALFYSVKCGGPYIRGRAVLNIENNLAPIPGDKTPMEQQFLERSSLGQVVETLTFLGHFQKIWELMGKKATAQSRERFIFSAAADLCLDMARLGKCPGVDAFRFSVWRIKNHI